MSKNKKKATDRVLEDFIQEVEARMESETDPVNCMVLQGHLARAIRAAQTSAIAA